MCVCVCAPQEAIYIQVKALASLRATSQTYTYATGYDGDNAGTLALPVTLAIPAKLATPGTHPFWPPFPAKTPIEGPVRPKIQ